MNKQKITQTEARILIYLKSVHLTRRYVTAISLKLGIDYGYVSRTLQKMLHNGWVNKQLSRNRVYYYLTSEAPVEDAMRVYLDTDKLQETLKDYQEAEEND